MEHPPTIAASPPGFARRPGRRSLAALTLVAGLAGCGTSSSSGSGPSGSSAAAPGTITLAISGPMTGDAAADGLHMKQGADLAIAEVNRAGGIAAGRYRGARLAATYLDDRETVDGSVGNANRVVSDDSIWAFLGTGFSDAAIATAPVLDEAGVSFLSTYASSDLIIATPRRNVFVVPPTFPAYAFSAAEEAYAQGRRSVAVLQANAGFGTHMADLFKQHFTQLGGRVVDTETYELGAKDVQGPVAKIAQARPDLVALAGLTGDDTTQLKALHAAGVTVPAIDLEAVLFSQSFLQNAGPDAEGVLGQTPSDPMRNAPAAAALRQGYTAAYGTAIIPDPAAFTYEAVKAVARALEASPADRGGLADALHAVSIPDTGVGRLQFDATGARLGGVLWYFAVKQGQFAFADGYQQSGPTSVVKVALQR